MAITTFQCKCGNTDASQAIEYDGALGYEAVVCKQCAAYSDHTGDFDADEWSMAMAGIKPELSRDK